jgi:hypothetical protein
MGLGLSGAYGAAEAQKALRVLEQDRQQKELLGLQRIQQEFENQIALRKIVEDEQSGQASRDVARGGLGLRTQEFEKIALPKAGRDAEQHGVSMRTATQTADAGDLKLGVLRGLSPIAQQQWASGLDFRDVAPDAAVEHRAGVDGRAAGLKVKSEFDAGGREVAQGKENIAVGGDLRRIGAQNAGALQRAMLDQVRQQNDPNLRALAAQASENPTILDGLDARARTAVMGMIASDGTLRTSAQSTAQKQVAEALAALEDLRKTRGQGGAVGMPDSLASLPRLLGYQSAPGSNERGYEAKLAELRAKLTLPRMEMMKGVLSDADMKVLRDSAGSLDPSVGEEMFNRELDNVERVLRIRAGAAPTPGGASAAPTLAPGERLAADGKTVLIKNAKGQWVAR